MHDTVKRMLIEAGSQDGRSRIFSLRDKFATATLQGLLASCDGMLGGEEDIKHAARTSYEFADAMLLAREE